MWMCISHGWVGFTLKALCIYSHYPSYPSLTGKSKGIHIYGSVSHIAPRKCRVWKDWGKQMNCDWLTIYNVLFHGISFQECEGLSVPRFYSLCCWFMRGSALHSSFFLPSIFMQIKVVIYKIKLIVRSHWKEKQVQL